MHIFDWSLYRQHLVAGVGSFAKLDLGSEGQGEGDDKRSFCLPHHRPESRSRRYPLKALPVILTTPDEIDLWMNAPTAEALALQLPLPDASLVIVARGEKQDGAPAAS